MTPLQKQQILLQAIADPPSLAELPAETLDWLVPVARTTGVMPRLAGQVVSSGAVNRLPRRARWHFEAEHRAAEHHRGRIVWELDRLRLALADLEAPLVLLKGAAYLAADLPPCHGRVSTDIDLLVPGDALDRVERRLRERGWIGMAGDSPHSAYYRKWLHEIPPLRHRQRGVVLDLHHNILPLRDPLQVDASLLIDRAAPLATLAPFRVLSPADMTLHSAAHLFRIGDFNRGLRDLWDMHELIGEFSQSPEFWDELLGRAAALRLTAPCYWALRYLARFLKTPIPDEVQKRAKSFRPAFPPPRWYDQLVERALFPLRQDGEDWSREFSLWALDKYPPPRVGAMLTPLFWLKRLPAVKV